MGYIKHVRLDLEKIHVSLGKRRLYRKKSELQYEQCQQRAGHLPYPLCRHSADEAEALIWKNGEGDSEAKSLLNQIRKRAGLPENSQATKVQLKNERRCELAFEFQPSRHLDLVRWHDAQEAYAKPLHGVKTTTNPDGSFNVQEVEIWPARTFNPNVNHVFPIPAKEVANSKNLKQNVY